MHEMLFGSLILLKSLRIKLLNLHIQVPHHLKMELLLPDLSSQVRLAHEPVDRSVGPNT